MYRVPQNTYQYFLAIPKRKFTKNGGCSVLSLHQSKGFKEFYLRFWQAADLEYLSAVCDLETNVGNSQQQKSTLYLDFIGAND